MLVRIGRLMRAELLKQFLHPFFYISFGMVVLSTLLACWGHGVLFRRAEGAPHALEVFAFGSRIGLKLGSFVLVVIGSLLLAGEFDRGTIKLLLTRPITRTELYLAKVGTGLLLAALFFLVVLSLSFGYGSWIGEMGPVWSEVYSLKYEDAEISGHAWKAVGVSAGGVLAAVFLGLLLSSFVESSGLAVAVALTLFLGMDLAAGFFGEGRYFFSFYPSYAFDTLQAYARADSVKWEDFLQRKAHLAVPGLTMGVCFAVSYGVFLRKNVLA